MPSYCCLSSPYNASYKYYVVLTFHGLVLIFARTMVVARKKIYGHLIRMYVRSFCFTLPIEYEDMKWPTNDPNRIPFHGLSSQFHPVLCWQQNFRSYFAALHCLSQLLAHIQLLGVNELLPRLSFVSMYIRWQPRKWLTIPIAKQCW